MQFEDWFLVLNLRDSTLPRRAPHQVELYYLPDDPGCLMDLVDAQHERAKAMRGQLIQWLDAALPGGLSNSTSTQSVETLAQLKALGYATEGVGGAELRERGWYVPDPDSPWCKRFE